MPEVITTLEEWRARTEQLRAGGRSLGLTLTMGALHDGHSSLLRRAASEHDVALATIFVNPLQFDDPGDLARYRSCLDDDLARCDACGVALVLAPSVGEVWPTWPQPTPTRVTVSPLSSVLEGEDRPGHFDGVATVVTKLLGATGRCSAYFGEKDYQQLCVVRQLVADLSLPAKVVGCPTVRDDDGLALSSRNARLSEDGRRVALVLSKALADGRAAIEAGEVGRAATVMHERVAGEPLVALAYAAVVSPTTLRSVEAGAPGTEVRLLIAGHVEQVRLIDNVGAIVGPMR